MIETSECESPLFDRTPQQRQQYAAHTAELKEAHPDVDAEHINRMADRRMSREFYSDLDRLANKRALAMGQNAASPHSYETFENRRAIALQLIRADIAFLHKLLPLPMIDTIGGADIETAEDAALQAELAVFEPLQEKPRLTPQSQHVYKGRQPPVQLPRELPE